MERTTNAIADDLQFRSPDELAHSVMEFAKGPKMIGSIMGLLVYVDGAVPPGMIEIRHKDGRTQRFPLDHPYIKGTKLQKAAFDAR